MTPRNDRIVVVGSANMDLMLRVPHLPRAGETLGGHGFTTAPGGKGANQAVAAARLGAAVVFVGCVGDDAFGAQAREALAADGADVTHLQALAGVPTGVALIMTDDRGENCIGLDAGANARLAPAQVDAAERLVTDAALLVCQLESPLETVEHALRTARRLGVATLLNPAPARSVSDAVLALATYLVPNQVEAAMLTGIEVHDRASAERAAQALRHRGVGTVLLTLGADGVLIADEEGVAHLPARPARAVDTTGAGDTFVGAFAAALGAGRSPREAAEYAQRAAAHGVQYRGAQASMPRISDIGPP